MREIFSNPKIFIPLIYFAAISLISIIICCYDKIAAKKLPKHRTRESTLLWLSAMGGSVAMLFTMLTIRHKTKHMKFMIGIPVIIILQLALAFCIAYLILN